MQRSLSHQNYIITFLYIIGFIIYSSLSSIYPFLPPMLAVLYIFFFKALDNNDLLLTIVISLSLMIFEANNGFILFSSIIYGYLIYKFVIPKISQNFNCASCGKISHVLLSYFGYYIFLHLTSTIFLTQSPDIDYYIVYYIVIEFFLVSLL